MAVNRTRVGGRHIGFLRHLLASLVRLLLR